MNETVASTVQEVQKSQFLRVVDVLFLGPLLFYSSTKVSSKSLKYLLIGSGALIVANNLNNYLKNLKTSNT